MPSARTQILILAGAQALFQTTSVMVLTIGGLAGGQIADSPRWATLPISAMLLGTAAFTFPASLYMAKVGRRAGFIGGALLGTCGGLVAAAGIWLGSMAVLAAGTLLIGGYAAFAQFYRFAAGEIADEATRSRAISLVLAGGVVAALLGPMLARMGGPVVEPAYLGSFLILAVIGLVAAATLRNLAPASATPTARTASGAAGPGRSLRLIARQPSYLVALFGAATGFGVMVLAMTATPIAMVHHQHSLGDAATVIQLHVLGMFLPSFFTGSLIARFGVVRVMLAGVLLLLGHVVTTMTGTRFTSFASALVLLGVGWNFLYVGGTTLLTSTYSGAETARAQATNDITIFAVGVVCSLGAGGLLQVLGWQAMNLLLLPWLAAAALALGWFDYRHARNGHWLPASVMKA